ncbi:MAG TPA: hypothetical protein VFJ15_06580 [Oleiagrimonas sp.]|nr:hypothetical protein [Oleiagrimonas sp.]
MRQKSCDRHAASASLIACRHRRLAAAIAGVAIMLWAGPLLAQHSPALDRFDIGIGTYHATSSTTLGASLPYGLFSGSASLEDDLGFDDAASLPRFRAHYLIGDHQGLSVDYYRYSRASGASWQHTLAWRDYRYDVDARVYGRVSFAFGSLAWRWWFGNDDDVFGLGFGASHYRASGHIKGRIRVNGETRADIDESTGASAWAPLLQVGWRHAFNEHWRMYLDAAGVFKGGGDLSGHIYNASLGVKWLPVEHLGFALEYAVNSIHIEQEHEYYTDSLDVQLNGPSAFVYLRF